MEYNNNDTAIVIIDPQNDVLSPTGKNWDAVGASVTENRTVENMERIFQAAKASGYFEGSDESRLILFSTSTS